MITKDQIVDLSTLDFDHPIANQEEIRRYNPQRFEMEHLTAIIHEDLKKFICVGYKEVTDQEFWCRGHMPGTPLMPGVIMCEAAAQVCSYFAIKHDLLGTKVVGFGGMEEVRFRGPVRPGDRLVVMCGMLKLRRGAIIACRFQGFVRELLVVDGKIIGVPLSIDSLSADTQKAR